MLSTPAATDVARHLVFPDALGYADLASLVRRAHRADPDAAVRLQATGTTLVTWVGVLAGSGLLADGAVVGVRAAELAAPAALDVVVSAAALTDRFARDEHATTPTAAGPGLPADGPLRLAVPAATAFAPWTGALPGAGGWVPVGSLPSAQVADTARAGIEEIASGSASGAGSLAVQALRQRVWSRPVPFDAAADPSAGAGPPSDAPAGSTVRSLPAGAAFAAYVLGFVQPDGPTLPVYRSGRWLRLRTPAGHVLAR